MVVSQVLIHRHTAIFLQLVISPKIQINQITIRRLPRKHYGKWIRGIRPHRPKRLEVFLLDLSGNATSTIILCIYKYIYIYNSTIYWLFICIYIYISIEFCWLLLQMANKIEKYPLIMTNSLQLNMVIQIIIKLSQ